MIALSLLLLATAAADSPGETVSMACVAAVNKAVAHQASIENAAGAAVTDAEVAARYPTARCVPSRILPGRIYVVLLVEPKPFVYRHPPAYQVEPSGEVVRRRDMPCEENPSVCR